MIFDETQLRKTIAILKSNEQLFEVRCKYKDKNIYSGYFNNADVLVDELKRLPNGDCNIHMTLNELHSACFSKTQRNKFEKRTESTTSDNDVTGYEWILIDLDPDRPSDTSSSNEELEKAKEKCKEVYVFLKNIGFYQPIFAVSGNGYHMLYKIHLTKNDDNKKLIEKFLKTLDMFFTDECIKIDTSVFNPSRICKLYGTYAMKGSNTEERPHRISYICGNPTDIQVNSINYIKKVCDLYPTEEKPQKYNNYNPREFDIEDWMNKYGLNYKKSSFSDGDKYILDHCVFDSSHKGKDAVILRGRNGALSYHCFHNSCSDKKWQDVRMLYEPDAYERKQKEYSKDYYSKPNNDRKEAPVIIAKENEPIFLTALQIRNSNEPEPEFIPTGIKEFDKLERGLARGDVSVWTGNSGGGKSSILTEIILNLVDNTVNGEKKPYSCVCYSGEMNKKKVLRWVHLMAAGKSYLAPTDYEDYYNVPYDIQDKIDNWLGENYYLYDNKYGHNFVAILAQLEKILAEKHLDVVILDNLMILDTTDLSNEELTAQKMFILELKKLAPKYNCHVICVCHPKKNYGLIRVADIKGSTDIRALADEIVLLHRVNEDFKKGAKEYFSWKDNNPLFEASNLIEIGKSRDGGNADKFIPLYFEKETKRLKNTAYENKIYGWNTTEEAKYGFDAINFNVDESPFE